jgi:hypothetical protein
MLLLFQIYMTQENNDDVSIYFMGRAIGFLSFYGLAKLEQK